MNEKQAGVMNINKNFNQQSYPFFLWLITNLFLLLLVLVVLKQASPMDTRLGRDSGIYMYVSNTLLNGELPYVNAWESKPPGIFFINAFALWAGMGTRWGVWLVEFLFLFLSIQFSFYLLKKQFGLFVALIGSAIGLWGLNRVLAGGNFTEEYSLLFSFASLWLWLYSENQKKIWSDIGIGLCLGFTILLRPNNIGAQVAIGLTLLIQTFMNKEIKALLTRYVIMAVSALVPISISGLFFVTKGAFGNFLEASLLYNLFYTGGNLNLKESLLEGIAHLGGAGGLFLVGFCFAVYQVLFKKQNPPHLIAIWIIVNGILEVFLSGVSGKAFEHYFICWIPNLVLSISYLITHLFSEVNEAFQKYSIQYSLAILFIGLVLFSDVPQYYAKTFNQILNQREKGIHYFDPVAAYVDANTQPEDFVLVWGGQAGINFLSKRDSPTPYIFYPLFEPSPFTDRISLAYYHSIKNNKPVLILDGSVYDSEKIVRLDENAPLAWMKERALYANPYLFEIITFIQNNYSLIEEVSGVPIYRINK